MGWEGQKNTPIQAKPFAPAMALPGHLLRNAKTPCFLISVMRFHENQRVERGR